MNISEHLGKSQQIKPCRRVPPYRRQLEWTPVGWVRSAFHVNEPSFRMSLEGVYTCEVHVWIRHNSLPERNGESQWEDSD
jgi:hypothetical protein